MKKERGLLILVVLCLLPSVLLGQDVYPKYDNTDFDADSAYVSDALNRLYIVGLQYLNSGDLSQAEISFRSILAFPYRSQDWRVTRYYKGKAHYYLGDIYFIYKNYAKASANYQSVVQEYGEIEEYTSAMYKLGRSLILAKEEKKGMDVLRDYNSHYGMHNGLEDNVLYWIARGHIGLENYSAALKVLHRILQEHSRSPMAYDVRMLIAHLNTDDDDGVFVKDKKKMNCTIEKSQKQADKILKEKELVNNIQQLLSLKEQLLHIKERKLKLLDTISKTRSQVLQNKQIFGKKSMQFMD